VQREVLAELRTPDRIRENLDVVDIVIGFLSSGGGKPDKPLGDYVDKVLRMRRRPFSRKVTGYFYCCVTLAERTHEFYLLHIQAREYCKLEHVLSLWKILSVELARLTWLKNEVIW